MWKRRCIKVCTSQMKIHCIFPRICFLSAARLYNDHISKVRAIGGSPASSGNIRLIAGNAEII